MSVVALVLAAGSSVRFGGDKRRALMADGRSLLVHSVERACAVFDEVRVVLRAGERAEALGLPSACRVISSVDCAQGMGHSLAAGAASLADCEARAVAVVLGDMPWVAPATLGLLARQAGASTIVLPWHAGRQGHPVLFGRDFWPALAQLQGDEGARSVVKAHPESCVRVHVQDVGVLQDVDRPEALSSPSPPAEGS
ncbi:MULTISPECIES: nucleotidyltransferase family protein [Pseudomonas]|uniref:nucleotidyltransferase family protein n=1 Tax=Pseudomonas TaxID=286 RepID=UPI0001FB8E5B|nr:MULTISPECIES: nucleotidyltransferase family protein [Pseudomonas]MCQ1988984.1 nucleotidyltransferase family protein [Pseudomonas sp. Eb3]EGB97302.1 molybdopterin-guanine dinucleotide biosynthesis protein MobA [Pseudomonas sp. TJI-51]MBA6120542.1 nucleotidyltransferase family protein [Pseudomonas juntendi]MBI6913789.1 nucleotidyltransferase family protein [Pseudomonas juntendi]MCF3156393.1 nucleotidyltransferase family protein [Pseudomonas juntendi]